MEKKASIIVNKQQNLKKIYDFKKKHYSDCGFYPKLKAACHGYFRGQK